MFLLNKLKSPDIWFFSILIGIVVVCVAIYFLIPIINHKVYEERRENLKKREETFRANLKNLKPENVIVEDVQVENVEANEDDILKEQAIDATESLDVNNSLQSTLSEQIPDPKDEVNDSLEDKKEE